MHTYSLDTSKRTRPGHVLCNKALPSGDFEGMEAEGYTRVITPAEARCLNTTYARPLSVVELPRRSAPVPLVEVALMFTLLSDDDLRRVVEFLDPTKDLIHLALSCKQFSSVVQRPLVSSLRSLLSSPTDSKLAWAFANKVVLLAEDLSTNIFVTPKRMTEMVKYVSIGIGAQGRVRYVMTPLLFCQFGVDNASNPTSLRTTIRSDVDGAAEFVRFCEAVNQAMIQTAFQNQAEWFGTSSASDKSIDVIGDRYYPINRRHLFLASINDATRFFGKTEGTVDLVQENTEMRMIIRFGPAWVFNNRFGLHVYADRIIVGKD